MRIRMMIRIVLSIVALLKALRPNGGAAERAIDRAQASLSVEKVGEASRVAAAS